MDGQIGSEWRRLEESVAEIGSFLEQLAERVADWGRHLELEAGQMRADIGAFTSAPRWAWLLSAAGHENETRERDREAGPLLNAETLRRGHATRARR